MRRWILVGGLLLQAASLRGQTVKVAPADAPAAIALAPEGERGTPLTVSGVVVGPDGRPVAGVSLYVYQTDAGGRYNPNDPRDSNHPRLHGFLRTDREGRYRFTTVRPGSYPNTTNPGHIHFEVSAPGYRERYFEIVFEGDPLIPAAWLRDAGNDRAAVAVVRLESTPSGGLQASHRVVIRPASG